MASFRLEEYGLLGAFDTNCMMRGEDTALVLHDDDVPELAFSELGSRAHLLATYVLLYT
jgi:hypothetical protein